jgi:hypothetical protein
MGIGNARRRSRVDMCNDFLVLADGGGDTDIVIDDDGRLCVCVGAESDSILAGGGVRGEERPEEEEDEGWEEEEGESPGTPSCRCTRVCCNRCECDRGDNDASRCE